ncbi:restriction endonuclease subunit S [Mycoplasmopsis bovirhinis]|uniref:restriction endonuclease subunit S n=1 Tax=Mycoplasmopsis bovirhinis TaxID=29553 RepID=UPI0012FE58DC|nr:restriction endonuclease subunit S [Mycoplasmopsis bovirhinis]
MDLVSYGYKIKSYKLSQISKLVSGKWVGKELVLQQGYPIINGGINPIGYYNSYNFEANHITISGRGTAGFVSWQDTKFWASNSCYVISNLINWINPKYLYYVIKNKQHYLIQSVYGSSTPYLHTDVVNNLIIPIPPLSLQNKIVAILDNFSSYTNNIAQGLPAEITLRQKQYEYYRNKLLSFNKVS